MQGLEMLIGKVLPFVTLAFLVLGLGYRIRKWQKAAVANMALYPRASTRTELWKKVLGEVLFFSSFRKENRSLWSQTWIFHLTLLVIIAGHTRLISDWPLRVLLGLPQETVNGLSAWGGGICGVVALVACLFLLFRRFVLRRVREISSGEDYLIVFLLLAILVSGDIMRFVTHPEITQARTYFATLFSTQPTQVPSEPMFLLHLFLVQALLIYLPFGKLLHIPGIFYSKPLIAKDY